jgi:hypothetical protein
MPIRLEFDQRQGSSDGGAVLLKVAEHRYGLISSMVGGLLDTAKPPRSIIRTKTFSHSACS